VDKLELKDGRATVTSVGDKPSVYENVDLEASNVSYKSQFSSSVVGNLRGGRTFKLDGKVGPLNPGDASLTPLDAKVAIKGLDLAKTGFVDPSTGISGIADLENTLASKGGVAHAQGNATLTKLQLVKGGGPSSIPVLVDFIVDHNLANSTGTLTQGPSKSASCNSPVRNFRAKRRRSDAQPESRWPEPAGDRSRGSSARLWGGASEGLFFEKWDTQRESKRSRSSRQSAHHRQLGPLQYSARRFR
jgi:hypothetical protein